MGEEIAPRGVLFADISDSTRLYDTMGDTVAMGVVMSCLDLLRGAVESREGRVVDRIGDELMCTFPSPESAAHGAIALQYGVDEAKRDGTLPEPVNIRIGFHFGDIVLDGERIFGETVYVAKRVSSLAKARQILTTRETVDALPNAAQVMVRFVDRTRLKGKSKQYEVFEVVWDPEQMTAAVGGFLAPPPRPAASREMTLKFGDVVVQMSNDKPEVTVGRTDPCTLVIEDQRVSRIHAKIELRRGAFLLTDLSTNGTQVVREGAVEPVYLHRDTTPLEREGVILFGSTGDEGLPAVTFRVREDDEPRPEL